MRSPARDVQSGGLPNKLPSEDSPIAGSARSRTTALLKSYAGNSTRLLSTGILCADRAPRQVNVHRPRDPEIDHLRNQPPVPLRNQNVGGLDTTPFRCAWSTARHTSANSPSRSAMLLELSSHAAVMGRPSTNSITKNG